MRLSIIIPLYNEGDDIITLLEQFETVPFPENLSGKEFIVFDDCSEDDSFELVSKYIENRGDFILLKHEYNKGKGAAIRTGIHHATGDLFLIQDGDLELSPLDIPSMIDAMVSLNVEFINGSRYLPGVPRPLASYKRYLGNKIFTNLTSVLINVKLTDMACGYKLIHKNLYQKINLKENRFGFEAELLIKALRIKKNNIAEVPVRYFPRNYGDGKKLNNTDALNILWTIIKYGVLGLK